MATRFELVLHGAEPVRLRAAGEAALAEIERVERLLSAYRDDSDIARINRHGATQPVRVTAETCRVLRQCVALSRACDGAFDISVGPLVRVWREAAARGTLPDDLSRTRAHDAVGADFIAIDEDTLSVLLGRPGMTLDLGAAGKGYAIDLAIEVLRDNGVDCALLHGGTSSVHVLGAPPESPHGWYIRWEGPEGGVLLRDGALSVSAAHGRAFEVDGVTYGHVLDPRTGAPVDHTGAAGVTGASSFLCDALSTAALVLGATWVPRLEARWTGYEAWTRPTPAPRPQ